MAVWPRLEVNRQQRAHSPAHDCASLQPGEQATDVEVCLRDGDEIGGYACRSDGDRSLVMCPGRISELESPPSTQHEDQIRGTIALAAWAALVWVTLGLAAIAIELPSSLITTRRPTGKPRA